MLHEIEVGELVYAKLPEGYMITTVRGIVLAASETRYFLDLVPGTVAREQFLDELEYAALN